MAADKRYLILDVGSTTTKALIIQPVDGKYRLTHRSEAATTVEAPYADVMVGIRQAIDEISCELNRNLLADKASGNEDTELLATSSAGGGLQVLVCGLVRSVTAESAERAALGAGAVLLDVFSADDAKPLLQRMEALRRLKPDMILLAGGVEGGQSVDFAVEFCDLLNAVRPEHRSSQDYQLPVIYAGNSLAVPLVQDTLNNSFELSVVPNIRPSLDAENLHPARSRIHELFLSHVMEHAPGYSQLKRMADAPLLPTPLAVGRIMSELARQNRANILGADIGGATTDIFSVVNQRFDRTVSANLGMSYSAGNVLTSAGMANIRRWLPFPISPSDLMNTIGNKVLSPTSIPETVRDLLIEQAVAREALRLSLERHVQLTIELPGERSRPKQAVSTQLSNFMRHSSTIDLGEIGLIVGSGGVLSHAPRRAQAALIILDAFQPLGYSFLAVDSVFMMPHLGVLTQRNATAALQVLAQDCLVLLGPSFSLLTNGIRLDNDATILHYELESDEGFVHGDMPYGDLRVLPLAPGKFGQLTLQPLGGSDVGAGKNAALRRSVEGGVVGIILDCRGRPLPDTDEAGTLIRQRAWHQAIGAYTREELGALEVLA